MPKDLSEIAFGLPRFGTDQLLRAFSFRPSHSNIPFLAFMFWAFQVVYKIRGGTI
jgi:hypothetical protein